LELADEVDHGSFHVLEGGEVGVSVDEKFVAVFFPFGSFEEEGTGWGKGYLLLF
jgi:hypothetical protein